MQLVANSKYMQLVAFGPMHRRSYPFCMGEPAEIAAVPGWIRCIHRAALFGTPDPLSRLETERLWAGHVNDLLDDPAVPRPLAISRTILSAVAHVWWRILRGPPTRAGLGVALALVGFFTLGFALGPNYSWVDVIPRAVTAAFLGAMLAAGESQRSSWWVRAPIPFVVIAFVGFGINHIVAPIVPPDRITGLALLVAVPALMAWTWGRAPRMHGLAWVGFTLSLGCLAIGNLWDLFAFDDLATRSVSLVLCLIEMTAIYFCIRLPRLMASEPTRQGRLDEA